MDIYTVKATAYRGILNQKTYVLTNDSEAVIIDAGANVEDVKQFVGNRKVLGVLLTHLHFDHIWCIEDYIKEWNADIYVVNGAEEKFKNAELNCSYLIRADMTFNVSQKNIKYYAQKLKLGSFEFDVIFTPGHSADSVCLLTNKNLFCGDLVLDGTIGRTDLYDSSDYDMQRSLEKLKFIDFKIAYPGHYDKMTKEEVLNCF